MVWILDDGVDFWIMIDKIFLGVAITLIALFFYTKEFLFLVGGLAFNVASALRIITNRIGEKE